VKLGGANDIFNKECYVYSQKLGRFGIRLVTPAESFTVTKVAPRIFTPEESSTVINRVGFYFENPDNDEVTIRIFDVTGALVRRNLERDGDNSMFWDGYDNDGDVVKGGVYVYQIEAGKKIITGTVVVAK
jgi:flagellar hook assembly protein FlgD